MRIEEFKKGQVKLARKIILQDGFSKIDTIAGVDQAFVNNRIISAIVVCDAERIVAGSFASGNIEVGGD